MGTQHHVAAPRTAAYLAALAAVLAGCGSGGGSNNVASHSSPVVSASPAATASAHASASPTASASPAPITGTYGVLYSTQAQSSYTVSIIGVDGKVAASATTSTPPTPSCGGVAAALVSPPVSTSDTRVYFMDGQGAVHWLQPNGDKDQAPIATLPAPTSSRRSMFAVSPDDLEMAVVVDDFTSTGATTQLFMYDLNKGGTQKLLYNGSGGSTLWPVGWHGNNNLVVGKIVSCTQGGGPFTGIPSELHVVDPADATRRFTIGSVNCPPVNRPSPAGVVCETPPSATVLNWTAATVRTYTIQGPVGAFLSPSGSNVAFVDNTGTTFTNGGSAIAGLFTCTWMDDTHVLAGGDAQQQARVANISSGQISPVAAQGDCGGRIPGGL